MKWKKKDSKKTIKDVVERNVGNLDVFLHPAINPFLHNLKEVVEYIQKYIKSQTLINVVADYDVDGVCSAAILKMAIEYAGGKVNTIIPHRFTEGYGFSEKILARLEDGVILTVDNGIAAHKVIKQAFDAGYDCAVVDHHLPPDDGILPDCLILDPHIEEYSEFKEYCGAGLAYRIAKELIDDEELLDKLLIFASIATVCDVMKLVGDNRNIVINGLHALNEGKGTWGLRMLLRVLKSSKYILNDFGEDANLNQEGLKLLLDQTIIDKYSEEDYGYQLGPTINASGRLFDNGAELPYHLIILDDLKYEKDMFDKAFMMFKINQQRKELVIKQLELAESLIENPENGICLFHNDFHLGIAGIIAGKLAEKYHVPAIVLSIPENGDGSIYKGSGRSVQDVHLKELLDSIKEYMVGYGGHAGAAGLSVKKENYADLKKAFHDALSKITFHNLDTSFYDLEIMFDEIPEYLKQLETYAPYGEGNPKVVFKVTKLKPSIYNEKHYKLIGNKSEHVKIVHHDKKGDIGLNMFYMAERFHKDGDPIDITCYGSLIWNYFNGFITPEIMCDDYEIPISKTASYKKLESVLSFI